MEKVNSRIFKNSINLNILNIWVQGTDSKMRIKKGYDYEGKNIKSFKFLYSKY